jgi:hypothetical protein
VPEPLQFSLSPIVAECYLIRPHLKEYIIIEIGAEIIKSKVVLIKRLKGDTYEFRRSD